MRALECTRPRDCGAPLTGGSHRRRSKDARKWLEQRPSLAELREAYPAEWAIVKRDLAAVAALRDGSDLAAYAASLAGPSSLTPSRRRRDSDELIAEQVRRQMAVEALKQLAVSAATGVHNGRVRFNLINGYIAQKLLFVRRLERRAVPLFWFRLVWPLLWQRRFLMPLVAPKGIYCFFSKQLIQRLAELIGDRPCLEIAAGDGTLSRLLADAGVKVTPTDDYSWYDVNFVDAVLKRDAGKALAEYQPEVVICSWPPPGNKFERRVFTTPSVQLYILIASSHRFATGNWESYESQSDFMFSEDAKLSRLVLPPELDAAVYVFRRDPPAEKAAA
jgi:hypothetical protein